MSVNDVHRAHSHLVNWGRGGGGVGVEVTGHTNYCTYVIKLICMGSRFNINLFK